MAGLRAGVPLVLVPTSWDKPDIALRMVEAGVAVRVPPRRCTPRGAAGGGRRGARRPALPRERPADRAEARGRARAGRRGGPHRGAGDAACRRPAAPLPAVRGERAPMRARLRRIVCVLGVAGDGAGRAGAGGERAVRRERRPAPARRAADRPARGAAHRPERLRRPEQRLRLVDGALPRADLRRHGPAGRSASRTRRSTSSCGSATATSPTRCPEPPARPTRTTWTCGRRSGSTRRAPGSGGASTGRARTCRTRAHRGKFVARDIAFRGMTVFRDARGRKRLYAGGVTADEYLPELKRKYPPRILSTRDGRHWRATPARDVVVRMPYGVFRPMGFRSLRVWRGRMYVTATPGPDRRRRHLRGQAALEPAARALPADHSEQHGGVRGRALQRRALRRHGRPRTRLRRLPDHPQALAVPHRADRHGRRRPRPSGDVRRLHARLQGPPLRRVQRLVQRGVDTRSRRSSGSTAPAAGRWWPGPAGR